MAEELNIPLGTVKTRMRQALIKLEKILQPIIY
jgi:DNA-directed RNA polymerase specialized sigma24 family protein